MTDEQRNLINRLHVYETTFEAQFTGPRASYMTEALADHEARMVSGLTCDGLRQARVHAGKFNTSRPGVVCYLTGEWGIVGEITQ